MAAAHWLGMAAGGWLLWHAAIAPKLTRETPLALIAEAVVDLALVWLCGAVISFQIYLATSLADFSAMRRAALRAACDAVWFAPALLLLSCFTPAALLVSIALLMNTARLLVARAMRPDYSRLRAKPERRGPLLGSLEVSTAFLSRSAWPPLFGALTAQAGFTALWKGYPLAAAACLGASAALLTAYAITCGAYEPQDPAQTPRTLWSMLASLLLAASLTTGSLQFGLALHPDVTGPMAATRIAIRQLLRPAVYAPAAEPVETPHQAEPIFAAPGDAAIIGQYSGVVLRKKEKTQSAAVLNIPLPSQLFLGPRRPSNVIPFTGVYWLFRPPAPRPPTDAAIRDSSPLETRFVTTDGGAIQMEAHQRLNPPVDIGPWGRIVVSLTNAEPAAAPLYANLILFDAAGGHGASQDLGLTDTALNIGPAQHRNTLEFVIPAMPALRRFDEIEVVFHLGYFGNSRSARVTVENFILLPKH
jgi:hypothetical protein